MFTNTRATKYVTKLIEDGDIVVVTGRSGSGKSSIIHHVALNLYMKKGYDVIPFVTGPEDIIQYRDMTKNQVFVIDDVCGRNYINEQNVRSWQEQADKIEKLFPLEQDVEEFRKQKNNGKLKILVSCRLHVFKDEKFKLCTMFNTNICNLQSDDYCLRSDEKLRMIKKYVTRSNVDFVKIITTSENCYHFPLLCKMSKEKQAEQITKLFSSPINSMKNDIEEIIETKPSDYCALVLCVLFHDGFDEAYLNPKTTPENIRQKIKEIVDNFNINLERELERTRLRHTFDRLDGTYIKKTGSVYSIAHDMIYDMVAVTCGSRLIELFIEYGPISFIAESKTQFCKSR